MDADPGDLTLAAYSASAEDYVRRARDRPRPAAVDAFLARFAGALPRDATVLELGSGSGADADFLDRRGLIVERTDATPAFVERLRAAGHAARRLDVRRDPLGGPYDAILAAAVLLHLTRDQFADTITRAHAATRPGDVLALTLKEGDGEEVTTAKLGRPRFFTYWREPPLRAHLDRAGWYVESLEAVTSDHPEDWLQVIARRRD